MKWDADKVAEKTRALEEGIVRRLAGFGIDLRLSDDRWDRTDGYTVRNGNLSAVCEIKTRTETLEQFIGWGTVLFDAEKVDVLRREADRWDAKAVLILLTSDDCLLWHEVTAMHIRDIRNCRQNHHSYNYVVKEVELIPIHLFRMFPAPVGDDGFGWDEIASGGLTVHSDEVQERAAIMHFDGGVCKHLAERIALYEVKNKWKNRDI